MKWPLYNCTLMFAWPEMIIVLGDYKNCLPGNDCRMIEQELLGGGKWLLCDGYYDYCTLTAPSCRAVGLNTFPKLAFQSR